MTAVILSLNYRKINEAFILDFVVKITFIFKKLHEGSDRSPARPRLIVNGNDISHREYPVFPKEIHNFFFSFCQWL